LGSGIGRGPGVRARWGGRQMPPSR